MSSSNYQSSSSSITSERNCYYKEYDHYNRNVVDKFQEKLKYEIDIIYKKYRLDYKIKKRIVDLEFDLDLHCLVKINRMMFGYDFHRDYNYFAKKEKNKEKFMLY